jgi:hypothetical protein
MSPFGFNRMGDAIHAFIERVLAGRDDSGSP